VRIPPRHPAIETGSSTAGCHLGMCRKSDFGSLAGQSISKIH